MLHSETRRQHEMPKEDMCLKVGMKVWSEMRRCISSERAEVKIKIPRGMTGKCRSTWKMANKHSALTRLDAQHTGPVSVSHRWSCPQRSPHHNRFTALFGDHLGEPVPEENFWTLWCKGRLTEADTLTIRLGATPSGLTSAHLHQNPTFYRSDALPAIQPTVSKH